MKLAALSLAAILAASNALAADDAKSLVTDAVQALFVDFDQAAATELLAEDYIQHNPAFPTGAAAIVGALPALKESGLSLTTVRTLAEGDLVVMHNLFENAQAFGVDAIATFDVFRVEGGKVVEHWDNIAPLAEPNPSGRTQLDGTTETADLDKTAENKALVAEFIDTILVKGELGKVTEYISAETYLQHNTMIGDGLDGLGSALAAWAEQGIHMVYTNTPLIVAEGNFVFAGSEGLLADKPTAFYDLFRVEDGKIVEHWDIIEEIPTEMAHENGKF